VGFRHEAGLYRRDGGPRGSEFVGAAPIEWDQVVTDLAPYSWFRPDYRSEADGKVTAFLDKSQPGHSLSQSNSTFQVATPAADAGFGGQLVATFVASSTTHYTSSLAAATWKFLHDGTGCEVFFVGAPTSNSGYFLSTFSAGVNPGVSLIESGNLTSLRLVVLNDSGGFTVNADGAIPWAGNVNGNPTYYNFSYQEALSPEYALRVRNGATYSMTGSSATAPGANNPVVTLQLGRRGNGANPMNGRWADLLVFNRVLSSAERAMVQSYILARYGF
jgi:hypothetical protein